METSLTVSEEIQKSGFAPLKAARLPGRERWRAELGELQASFSRLALDTQMGDGGRYRYRRYSRFLYEPKPGRLKLAEGNSIYQSLQDNPLNGGLERTFEPLEEGTVANPLLRHLIEFDFTNLPIEKDGAWVVGVHQVRIRALPGVPGQPTPEGIHIDAEQFTVQHLLNRQNVRGGVFLAYDQQHQPCFEWLQEEPLDSVFFTGKTLHSASPVVSLDGKKEGFRDILLIDFDPAAT